MVGGTVPWDYFPDGAYFDCYYGNNVSELFVNDPFILRLDLLVSNRFKWVAECFRWDPNGVFKSDKFEQEL